MSNEVKSRNPPELNNRNVVKATRKDFIIIFILLEKLINTCNLSFRKPVIASRNLNFPTESNLKIAKSNSVQSTTSSDFSERTQE